MATTEKTDKRITEMLKSKGIQWTEECNPGTWKIGSGFTLINTFFGKRAYYENIMIGSSTFYLLLCDVVKTYSVRLPARTQDQRIPLVELESYPIGITG